ncbi:hypothetical protein, partial [Undibacterium sp. 10I3]|uniref:hypothetical protein n=1 Tax=Undibacterium sp. 10I3 TaxID=3048579 RepID=UPI002B225B31
MNQREIVGLTSCNANSTCGSLTFTSSTNAGNYTGTVSITPSPAGTGTSLGINLTVNANPEMVTYIHTDGLGSPVAKTVKQRSIFTTCQRPNFSTLSACSERFLLCLN